MSSNRLRLTWSEKVAVLEKAARSPSLSYNELARWAVEEFGLPTAPGKTTIGRILRSSTALRGQPMEKAVRKKAQPRSHVLLDENVVEFVLLAEAEGVCLTGAMIIQHARELVLKLRIPPRQRPRLGPSWLRRLQERYGFHWRRSFGESGAVQLDACKKDIERLKQIISSFRIRDVFNMDESAFFYNAVPRGSICKSSAPALKQSKARLTMTVCTNADGSEKLPILYLGTASKPRWFDKKPSSLHYFGTEKGWMTSWMYQQWLVALDERMRAQNRNILLLVDNASSHHEVGLSLSNVRVEKLPPNTTAKIQPLDQGIINSIKRYILSQKMMFALDRLGEGLDNPYNVDQLTALLWCETAWSKVSASTIQHCWNHSGLIQKSNLQFILT